MPLGFMNTGDCLNSVVFLTSLYRYISNCCVDSPSSVSCLTAPLKAPLSSKKTMASSPAYKSLKTQN